MVFMLSQSLMARTYIREAIKDMLSTALLRMKLAFNKKYRKQRKTDDIKHELERISGRINDERAYARIRFFARSDQYRKIISEPALREKVDLIIKAGICSDKLFIRALAKTAYEASKNNNCYADFLLYLLDDPAIADLIRVKIETVSELLDKINNNVPLSYKDKEEIRKMLKKQYIQFIKRARIDELYSIAMTLQKHFH